MNLRHAPAKKKLLAILAASILAVYVGILSPRAGAYTFYPEYQNYVHTYLDSLGLGNWTYLEKPMFPVLLNDSEVPIGQNWSIVCPLRANHTYHVYCYGAWINNGSEPKTDYDIYVYDPSGELEGCHTESAGLPEHLGTAVDEPFFSPRYSGNYTFVLVNDQRESKGAEQATLTIIEKVECNAWIEHYVDGKDSASLPTFNTSWAYELVTESERVEAWIRVPETLDMYEARMYLMADPASERGTILNDVPLAWEPGLYGERCGSYGGYNLESKEYRGLAYASCEFYGQDMFLNFTSPNKGKSLYHLVLIGETGNGTIEFLIKTQFTNACLKPLTAPTRVYPNVDTTIAYISNITDLRNAALQYSTDGWTNSTRLEMEISENRTCSAIIPGQSAGTTVAYQIEAADVLENVLTSNGSYAVKDGLAISLTAAQEAITQGENVTVRGLLTPAVASLPVYVHFTSANESKELLCYTRSDGTFTTTFRTNNTGMWEARARFEGNSMLCENTSSTVSIEVREPSFLAQYSLYIGGGAGAAALVGAIVYWKKMRQ